MSYGGTELAASFRTVRGNTVTIAEEIPENKYDFKPASDLRTVAELLAHIAMSPSIALTIQRHKVADFKTLNFMELVGPIRADEAKQRTKTELVALLKA